MASLAVSLALHNDLFSADVIEANEFQDLAQRYHVYGVPRTVINDVEAIEGAVPETNLIQKIVEITGKKA